MDLRTDITREEVAAHNGDEQWIIYQDRVYNISKNNWVKRHPGGYVISYYKGDDATEAIDAFHPNFSLVQAKMKPLLVGTLHPDSYQKGIPSVISDFRELRTKLTEEGYFKSNKTFYILHIIQIILLEILAVALIHYYGGAKWSFFFAGIILATSQTQAGWLQHDFGHLSVFEKNMKWNGWAHLMTIGALKGASSKWWKSRHNRHHAKTNAVGKDPDIHTEPVFFWSPELLKKGNRFVSYQTKYWWFIGPPAVTTFLFVYQNILFVFRFQYWSDLFSMLVFLGRFMLVYSQFLNGWQVLGLYMWMRLVESHWFTWVTSMNHLPREIRNKNDPNWVSLHLSSTQNVSPGLFHDWFTGHLNYQIEHHLFPTMPRHNYPIIAPRVKMLCEKHNIPYRVRTMYECCTDILNKLDAVGKSWDKERALKHA